MSLPVDPDLAPILAELRGAGDPDFEGLDPRDMRRAYRETRMRLRGEAPPVSEVRDLSCPGPAGPIPLRLYRGAGTAPGARLPALVFFHGGGWVVGDLDTHDVICRILANEAGCAVVAVDYRLAPEHPFPAAVEDAEAATRWIHDAASTLGIDPSRLALGGDSAGGNLAAVVALLLRDKGGPAIGHQVLLYPAVDQRMAFPSFARFTTGLALTATSARWFRDLYLPDAADREDPRASPLLAASQAGLPPAFILTVGHDPLVDEGRAFAEALGEAGIRVRHLHVNDQMHGCLTMTGAMAAPRSMLAAAGSALRDAFGPEQILEK